MERPETEEGVQRFQLRPIGYIRCKHNEAPATPIQPVHAQGCRTRAEILPEYEEGLRDLKGFSHIYIIYVFDEARSPSLTVTPSLDALSPAAEPDRVQPRTAGEARRDYPLSR